MKPTCAQALFRGGYYAVGLAVLALGLTLNTKTGLGASPIITVPFGISQVFSLNFGNVTLLMYGIFIACEFIVKRKNAKLYDLLQLPLAVVFTRFLNLFSDRISVPESMGGKLLLLAFALVLSGVGAAMSLNMRLVPNPADGIVQAIADAAGKSVGLCKNLFDLSCVIFSAVFGLRAAGHTVGIGIGTLLAMLLVGRVIAVFNRFTLAWSLRRAGMEKTGGES